MWRCDSQGTVPAFLEAAGGDDQGGARRRRPRAHRMALFHNDRYTRQPFLIQIAPTGLLIARGFGQGVARLHRRRSHRALLGPAAPQDGGGVHIWPRLPGAEVQRSRDQSQVVALMSGDGEYRRPPAEEWGWLTTCALSPHSARALGTDCPAGRVRRKGCSVEELLREVEDVQRIHS